MKFPSASLIPLASVPELDFPALVDAYRDTLGRQDIRNAVDSYWSPRSPHSGILSWVRNPLSIYTPKGPVFHSINLDFSINLGREVQKRFPTKESAPGGLRWEGRMDKWPPYFWLRPRGWGGRNKGGYLPIRHSVISPPAKRNWGYILLQNIIHQAHAAPYGGLVMEWVRVPARLPDEIRFEARPTVHPYYDPPAPPDQALCALSSWAMIQALISMDHDFQYRPSSERGFPYSEVRRLARDYLVPAYQDLLVPEARVKEFAL